MKSTIVNAELLKQFTSISDNIDCELLNPFLQVSQEMYIAPILGEALYEDIVTKFDNNTFTGTCDQTLYDEYLIPAIGYSALYSAAPFLAYKMQRNGVVKHGTDTLVPVDVDEFTKYSERLDNLKNFYLRRLEKYLCEHSDCFPLYVSPCNPQSKGVGGIFTSFQSTKTSSDFWLGETSTGCGCGNC